MARHDPIDREARAAAIAARRGAVARRRGDVVPAVAASIVEPVVFDPSLHNIDGVLAYVDEHPDELLVVAERENAGKARATLLAALTARVDAAVKAEMVEAHTEANEGED